MNSNAKTIGILALQGDFEAHRKVFEDRLGLKTQFVRTIQELRSVDALVLPGGESTTLGKLMARIGLDAAIQERGNAGMPLFGTCAGLILLADSIEDRPDQPTLRLMRVTAARNAFGRQLDSFEADIPITLAPNPEEIVRGVFIRAPYVVEAAPEVEIVARFRDKIVGARQGNCLGIAFHPELTEDIRVHARFAEMVAQSAEPRS
jgi:5'-phosphate synthase pdxT subunit